MKIRNAIQLMMAVLLVGAMAFAALSVSAQQQPSTTTPAFLGIRYTPHADGVEVTEVVADSPAQQAGLTVGDVITEVDGTTVNADGFAQMIHNHAVGDTLTLTVQRGGNSMEISVTLAEMPTNLLPVPVIQHGFLGLNLEASTDGLTVSAVSDGSPAADAGLQAGDILLAIGDTQVTTVAEARTAVSDLAPGASVDLHIRRDGEEQTIIVTVGTAPVPSINMRFNEFSYDATNQSWTIGQISDNSPLYTAGLRQGDVITAFNGTAYDMPGLMRFITGLAQDATVTLTVQRGTDTVSIDVPATELQMMGMRGGRSLGGQRGNDGQPGNNNGQPGNDGQPGTSPRDGFPFMVGGARLGVTFVTLDTQSASEHNVTQTDGALITEVDANSPAAEAGLQANDIVTAVDGDSVDAEHTLRDRLFAYEPGDVITLDVMRGTETLQIQVTLGQPEIRDTLPFRFFFGNPGTQQPVTPPPPAATPAA